MFLGENRERIEREYHVRQMELPEIFTEIEDELAHCEEDVALAVRYLYTYTPYSDIGNYPFAYFLDFAEHGVKLWRESEEVQSFPEEIFLNYVLFHRVNEEEILPCRSLFYGQLKERVQGMDTKSRMLEVNYWCAEKATYQSTDDRTLSALSVYKRGTGRCGEESTFMVNALRSVGIPARQVYAPRWSHCDDNHAWVEMWSEGVWYFTGACEPQPTLNKGWFTNASSRAMLIHSRRFNYWGEETAASGRVIGKCGTAVMFNELERYAVVKKVEVRITDQRKRPVSGARVSFEVLNYAQFLPIAEVVTDESGLAHLFTGVGSLHVHAEMRKPDELWGDTFIDTGREDVCSIILTQRIPEEEWRPYDMIAPHDTPVHIDSSTKEQILTGAARLKAVAEIREAHIRAFTNPDRDNFLTCGTKSEEESGLRQALLDILTVKDQTDCRLEVLEEHLQYALLYKEQLPQDVFVRYVLNPRVEDEILFAYREKITMTFDEKEKKKFREAPSVIWDWINLNIRSCPEKEQDSLITVPAACLKLHVASLRSKKILFVAVARTFGIPARLNPASEAMEYMSEGMFVPVLPEESPDCSLILKRADGSWSYFQDWSMSRLTRGRFLSLNLSDTDWEGEKLHLELKPGIYRILTANRLPNGSVLTNRYEFRLEGGQEKQIELVRRAADLGDMLLNIDMPDFYVRDYAGREVGGRQLSDDGSHIFFWLEGSREPTIHILNELLEQESEYEKYQSKMIFIVRSRAMLEDKNISQVLKRFPGIKVFFDDFEKNVELLGRRVYVDHEKLPLIIVTSEELTAVYAQSGYNVGTGNMILRILEAAGTSVEEAGGEEQ